MRLGSLLKGLLNLVKLVSLYKVRWCDPDYFEAERGQHRLDHVGLSNTSRAMNEHAFDRGELLRYQL